MSVTANVEDGVGWITLDRPPANSYDPAFLEELDEAIGRVAAAGVVVGVVRSASEKFFSAGADVKGFLERSADENLAMVRRAHQVFDRFADEAPLFIAAIAGHALGGGYEIALACDVRIAAEGTRFRLPEVGHGVIPDTGGAAVLFQMCGHGVVSDLVLTGRVLEVDEAKALGIVSRVVPEAELDDTAREMAERVAAAPAATVKMAREVLRHLSVPAVRASMADEMVFQTFVNRSDDFAEFRAARAEDRPPRYTGS